MSAWARLSSLIKRHAVWLGGILVAAAGTYVTSLLTPVQTLLSEKTAEMACKYRQTPISNDSQFIILVSRLEHDPDRSHTNRVMRAFQGEKGFLVVPICDSLNIDYSPAGKELQTATDATLQLAGNLIKGNHADLLLFGDVSERDKAIVIFAVNEHGGCDLHPKPTKIEQGVLSEDFTAEEKEKLIEVSLKEIQSACRNQSSIDWPLFAKRMDKMELFLKYFDFSRAKSLAFASSYIDAVRLLYRNGQGDIWFSKGEELAKSVVDDYQAKDRSNGKATDEGLSGVYETYATLFMERFDKTKDNRSLDAAFGAFGKAIGFDPQDVTAYKNRGNAYRRKGDWDRAIADYDKSISLEPNDALSYGNRGYAYSNKGDWDRAIADYDKSISLEPNDAWSYGHRGYAYSNKSDWDRAIADYDKAIDLDPKNAVAYEGRGEAYSNKGDWDRSIADYTNAMALDPLYCHCHRGLAYLNKGEWDHAIDDYTKVIDLDPKVAAGYTARSYAYRKKGDWDRAIADCNKAIDLDPKNAVSYENRGLAYLNKGEWDHAIADYNKAIDLDPKNAVSYEVRGEAYEKKGDWGSAIEDYSQAIRLDAKRADLWNIRCWARAIAGKVQDALSDCNRSLDLEPNNANNHDSRAFVYLKMGKAEDAIADYNGARPELCKLTLWPWCREAEEGG